MFFPSVAIAPLSLHFQNARISQQMMNQAGSNFQQVFADELVELVTTRVSGSTSGDRALSVASETWDEEKVRKLGWSLGGSVRKNFLNIMVPVLFC